MRGPLVKNMRTMALSALDLETETERAEQPLHIDLMIFAPRMLLYNRLNDF